MKTELPDRQLCFSNLYETFGKCISRKAHNQIKHIPRAMTFCHAPAFCFAVKRETKSGSPFKRGAKSKNDVMRYLRPCLSRFSVPPASIG